MPTTTTVKKPATPKSVEPVYKHVDHADDIKLGFEVIDVVSKLQGIVTVRCDMLTGNIQFGIHPPGNGDEYKDAHFIDWHLLAVVSPGVSGRLPPVDATVTLKLGQGVKDKVSGFEGTVVEKTTFQNGCVYFSVQPPTDKKGVLPNAVLFSHIRLVADGKAPKMTAPEPTPRVTAEQPKPKKPPGGPSRPLSSFRMA